MYEVVLRRTTGWRKQRLVDVLPGLRQIGKRIRFEDRAANKISRHHRLMRKASQKRKPVDYGAGKIRLAFSERVIFLRNCGAGRGFQLLNEHRLKAMLSCEGKYATHYRMRRVLLIHKKEI